jgi:hypothetical protein
MKRSVLTAVLLVIVCAGCSDGTIVFVDDDDGSSDTTTVRGNISDLNPQVAGADIVVFVFTGLVDDGTFEHFEKQRSVAIASDADPMEFTVTQVANGNVTVVFLQDEASEPDGRIDPGDPIATLDDPDEVLSDVKNGETIEITDVDVDFTAGSADAEVIRSIREEPAQ